MLKKPNIKKPIIWMALLFSVLWRGTAYADDITYSFETEPSMTKTIRWSLEGGADEYRFISGSSDEGGYGEADRAGSGGAASVTVKDNGNYTLYARKGEEIYYVQVPITTVDRTPPQINITNIESTSEKHVSVFYEIEDYYGVREVRFIAGQASESAYSTASVVHGGVIENLLDGVYTLFAKDLAGNISVYTMAVSSDYNKTESSSVYQSESSTHESTEWAKTDLWVEPTKPAPTKGPEPTTSPEPTPTPETTYPEETVPSSNPTEPEPTPTTNPPELETPEPVTEGNTPEEPIPTNPIVPSTAPPVERFPQTGSFPIVRLARAAAVAGLGVLGAAALLVGRIRRRKPGEKGPDEEQD